MKVLVGLLLGLLVCFRVEAERLSEVVGQVRFAEGMPVTGVQVQLFDLGKPRQGVVTQTTTDASGQFVLSLGPTRPQAFALGQNYPNPFNPRTVIPYQLSSAIPVRLEVFNLLGQLVVTLVDEVQTAGVHTAHWDARDMAGQGVAAGIYIYRLTAGEATATGRMVLVDGPVGEVTAGTAPVAAAEGVYGMAVETTSMYGLAVLDDGVVAYVDSAFVLGAGPVDVILDMPSGKIQATHDTDPELIKWSFRAIDLDEDFLDLLPVLMVELEKAFGQEIENQCPSADPNVKVSFHGDLWAFQISESAYNCLSNRADLWPGWGDIGTAVAGTATAAIGASVASALAVKASIVAVGSSGTALPVSFGLLALSGKVASYTITGYSLVQDIKYYPATIRNIVDYTLDRHAQTILLGELPDGKVIPGLDYVPITFVKNTGFGLGTIPLGIRFSYTYTEGGNSDTYSDVIDLGPSPLPIERDSFCLFIPTRPISFSHIDQNGTFSLNEDREFELRAVFDRARDLIFRQNNTPIQIVDFYPRFTAEVQGDNLVLDASTSVLPRDVSVSEFKWSIGAVDHSLIGPQPLKDAGNGMVHSLALAEIDRLVGETDSLDVLVEVMAEMEAKRASIRLALRAVDESVEPEEPRGGESGEVETFVPLEDVDMEFVWIEPGVFQMGHEGAQHEVEISRGFYLGQYEVTQAQWEAVMGTRPWQTSSGRDLADVVSNPSHPAVYLSWHDAQAFVSRLNDAAGDSLYRLPAEAEWEYACRAGTQTLWSFGDDENELTHYAWYEENTEYAGEDYAHEVGKKRPNAWGLYDMHGNVWEWVQDWYSGNYYDSSPRLDPRGPASGFYRVSRGGDFTDSASGLRSVLRGNASPRGRYGTIGMRILKIR